MESQHPFLITIFRLLKTIIVYRVIIHYQKLVLKSCSPFILRSVFIVQLQLLRIVLLYHSSNILFQHLQSLYQHQQVMEQEY